MTAADEKIRTILGRIYGALRGEKAFARIASLTGRVAEPATAVRRPFSEADAVLITYGDTLVQEGCTPLQALDQFARQYLTENFSAIHLLPFFPFSSDDGFSVMDYMAVNPAVGTWQDVERLGSRFDLMFDYVLNHISAQSRWFRDYLAQKPGYRDLAIEVSPQSDLSAVTRPRALPLLTAFEKADGTPVHVWTTFSDDQIDLNYDSLDVLADMVEVLLFYLTKGARLIRMDAVAYLWKQIGTACIHLPQTHDMVRLFRAVLDRVRPEALIITETNVPHAENVSYFGNGLDEAQMVYNFTLPPLLLHTFQSKDVRTLSQWAQTLTTPSAQTTFFNFTASHDGIGVRPLEGILSPRQIDAVVQSVRQNGGQVSFKQNPDGSQSPYELNVTYVDALGADPAAFLASQAIQLALPGVPAVYIHSLLGSRNWHAGVEITGRARTINRQQLNLPGVLGELKDANSFRSGIFKAYAHLLKVRRAQPAFNPNADFGVLDLDRRIFGLRRSCDRQQIYALTNVSSEPVEASVGAVSRKMRDLLSDRMHASNALRWEPYQTLWLEDNG